LQVVGEAEKEEVDLEPVEVTPVDFIAPQSVEDFRTAWEGA
jgi:hypothetical protein